MRISESEFFVFSFLFAFRYFFSLYKYVYKTYALSTLYLKAAFHTDVEKGFSDRYAIAASRSLI